MFFSSLCRSVHCKIPYSRRAPGLQPRVMGRSGRVSIGKECLGKGRPRKRIYQCLSSGVFGSFTSVWYLRKALKMYKLLSLATPPHLTTPMVNGHNVWSHVVGEVLQLTTLPFSEIDVGWMVWISYAPFPSGHFQLFYSSAPQPLFQIDFLWIFFKGRVTLDSGGSFGHQMASTYFNFNACAERKGLYSGANICIYILFVYVRVSGGGVL